MYCAIIGDIINSKQIQARDAIQIKLKQALTAINNDYYDEIKSNFVITLGDEFQGVLSSAKEVLKIVEIIKTQLYPVKIRFGIGLGDIYTEINRNESLGADGPAYYSARNSINYLKKAEKKYEVPSQYLHIQMYQKKDSLLELINATLALCSQIEDGWTKRQREIIELMKQNNNSQKNVADILDINKSNIQRSLNSSKYYNYIFTFDKINNALDEFWEKINVQ